MSKLLFVALLALAGCEARVHLESKPMSSRVSPPLVKKEATSEDIKAWLSPKPAPIVVPVPTPTISLGQSTNVLNLPYLIDTTTAVLNYAEWSAERDGAFAAVTVSDSTNLFTLESTNGMVVSIQWEGNVTLGDHVTNLTEVSKFFWKSVSEVFPEFKAALLKHQAAE